MSQLKTWTYIESDDCWMSPKIRSTFVALDQKFLAKKYRGQVNQKTGKPSEGSYIVSGIFGPDVEMSEIKKACNAVARTKKPGADIFSQDKQKNKGVEAPFVQADTVASGVTSKGEEVDLEGWLSFKATSGNKVVIKDKTGAVIDEDDIAVEAYSGRWMRLLVRPAYSEMPKDRVTFYLEGVQLLGNDDKIGGFRTNDGSAFEAVDDEDEDDV